MEVWNVDLSGSVQGVKPLAGNLASQGPNIRHADHNQPGGRVCVILDRSRWGQPVEVLRPDGPGHTRWYLVADCPIPAKDISEVDLEAACFRIDNWNGQDVASLLPAFSRLLGPEFGIALIDALSGQLTLVRDAIGSRPLYWRRQGDCVSFSSCRKRLLRAGEPVGINAAAVAVFLGTGGSDWTEGEFLAGFSRVPHAGYAQISRGHETTGRWWAPRLRAARSSVTGDRVEAAREVRRLLESAIAQRTRSGRRIAAHVSGGIDSTGVAGITARQQLQAGRRLLAAYAWSPPFSASSPDLGWSDERRRIEAFAQKEGVQIGYSGATAEDFILMLSRPIETEGTADLADELPVLQMAQSDGVDIMVSGWGGDEVFSSHGFSYLSYLLGSAQWDKAVGWIRNHLRSLKQVGPVASMLWWQGIHPILPDFIYRLFDPYALGGPDHSLIAPDLLRRHRVHIEAVQHRFRLTSDPAETSFRHLMAGHVTERMESWDAWSREYGFHYTYPLTDQSLIEHLLNLPPEVHFPNEKPRGLALESLHDVLPPGVHKHDAANEAFRHSTRQGAWKLLASLQRNGHFNRDCPWIDMKRFHERLANPMDQSSPEGLFSFLHLFTAVRVWHLWTRRG